MKVQITNFGKAIRHWCLDHDKSVSWLCSEITSRTGMYCDTSYIAKISKGERNSDKIVQAIKEITGIELKTIVHGKSGSKGA